MTKQNVLMPQMGESIQEGTVTKWHKKVGDKVQREEVLFEISTDKVDTEIPSPTDGVLLEVLAKEGDTVKVNTVVAVIDTAATAATAPQQSVAAQAQQPAQVVQNAAPQQQNISEPVKSAQTEAPKSKPDERVMASPLARKIAKEHDINLSDLKGSGGGNKIVKDDVLSAIKDSTAKPVSSGIPAQPMTPLVASALGATVDVNDTGETLADGTRIKRVTMSTMRKKIAEHMVMSKRTSPHVTSVIEIDLQKIVDLRAKNKDKFESQYGFKLTFMPFFMDAVLKAIKAVPIVNSSVENDTIIYKKDVHLGIAVALEAGLIVPVIKNAHEKNFVGLGHELNSLAEKARNKKLLPDDVKGGTMSITNFGGFGTIIGQPIINQPQVAIFGIGAMQKKPVVINDAIAIRTMCYCVLSFDHRVIDGSDSGKFLSTVKNVIENWDTAL